MEKKEIDFNRLALLLAVEERTRAHGRLLRVIHEKVIAELKELEEELEKEEAEEAAAPKEEPKAQEAA